MMKPLTRCAILGFIFALTVTRSLGGPDCSKVGPDNPHCQGDTEEEEAAPTTTTGCCCLNCSKSGANHPLCQDNQTKVNPTTSAPTTNEAITTTLVSTLSETETTTASTTSENVRSTTDDQRTSGKPSSTDMTTSTASTTISTAMATGERATTEPANATHMANMTTAGIKSTTIATSDMTEAKDCLDCYEVGVDYPVCEGNQAKTTTAFKRTTKAETTKTAIGSNQNFDEEIENALKNIEDLDTETQVKEIEKLTENIISKATTTENGESDTNKTKNDMNQFEKVADLVSKIAAHVPKGERIVIDDAESGIVGSVENIQIEEDKSTVEISLNTDGTDQSQESLPTIVLQIDSGIKDKGGDLTVSTLYSKKDENTNSTAPFKNDNENVAGSNGAKITYSIGSGLLSIQVLVNGSSESVAPEFTLAIQKNNKANQEETPICVYWNPVGGYFSQEGVTTVEGDDDNVKCHSEHLTSFAILMQTTEVEISDRNLQILEAMTLILTPFSILGLGLTVIIFYVIKPLRKSMRNKIHFNLSFSLFFGQLIFLTAVDKNADFTACIMIAMVLHYFFLSSFGWMLVEGVSLYYKIVKVSGESTLRRRYYKLIGWGLPVPIVVLTAAIRFSTYVSEDSCWLSREDGVIWAFVGPASLVIAINIVLLVQIGCIMYNSLNAVKEVNSTAGMRTAIFGTLLLTPILGITWMFGLLAIGDTAIIFQYCFVVGNCLQGVFIFAIFVVFNSEVRAAINLTRKKRRVVNTVIPCDLKKVPGTKSFMPMSSEGTEVSTLSEAETTSGGNSSNSSSTVALREGTATPTPSSIYAPKDGTVTPNSSSTIALREGNITPVSSREVAVCHH